jgi:hypothetical protein
LLFDNGAGINAEGGWLNNSQIAALAHDHNALIQLLAERGARENIKRLWQPGTLFTKLNKFKQLCLG